MSIQDIERIAEGLDVSVEWLLYGNNDLSNSEREVIMRDYEASGLGGVETLSEADKNAIETVFERH